MYVYVWPSQDFLNDFAVEWMREGGHSVDGKVQIEIFKYLNYIYF